MQIFVFGLDSEVLKADTVFKNRKCWAYG